MFCIKCGKELKNEARFCPRCGEQVVESDIADIAINGDKEHKNVKEKEYKKNKKPVLLWIGIIGIVVLVAIVIATVVITRGSKKAEYDEKLDLGRKYLLDMNYEQAILAFEEAIKIDPKKKDAYIELAEVYAKQGEVEKALEILGNAKDEVDDSNNVIIEKKIIEIKRDMSSDDIIVQSDTENSIVKNHNENDKNQISLNSDELEDYKEYQDPVLTSIPSTTPIPTQNKVTEIYGDVGDVVTFGSYEQDNDYSNGKEPIEWIVLSNDGNKMLLLSKYALDCKPYNEGGGSVTWENCTLRNWLNNNFFETAFSDNEKLLIYKNLNKNKKNAKYGINGGNDTSDYVFLLSIDDMLNVNYGFSSDLKEEDSNRKCAPSNYAIAMETYKYSGDDEKYLTSDGLEACWWWLRSPGESVDRAALVFLTGEVLDYGDNVEYINYAVRPALYLNLTSSTVPVQKNNNSKSEKVKEAFQAYLELVKTKKSKLDVPFVEWDSSKPEVPRQTVAIIDVWGDDIPELILAESQNPQYYYNPLEPLCIYTYENGKIKKIFERNVDLSGCDFIYYDLLLTKANELYLDEVSGCDRGYGTWSHLLSNGEMTEKIVMTKIDGYEAAIPYDTFYDSNDEAISQEQFYNWKSEFDSLVYCSIFSTAYDDYGDSIAMTYSEAISFLDNWQNTDIYDGIEWFEKNNYKIIVKRLSDTMSGYEYSLLFSTKRKIANGELSKDYDNVVNIPLNRETMTKAAALSSVNCRGEQIACNDLGYGEEYFYSIDSSNLKREGIFLFGKSLKPSYLVSESSVCYDAYNNSMYGPVIYIEAAENETSFFEINTDIIEKREKYIVKKDVYFGFWGDYHESANVEIIYTIEESNKSEYVITGIKIKYLE